MAAGKISVLPRMAGFQAAGAAPIVDGKPIEHPQTIATAIRIGNPASWTGASNAISESNGLIDKVTDEEILEAYRLLAEYEGVFVEPASAASVAGLLKLGRTGRLTENLTAVAVLTGHGLKDPDRVVKTVAPPVVVPATLDAVVAALGY